MKRYEVFLLKVAAFILDRYIQRLHYVPKKQNHALFWIQLWLECIIESIEADNHDKYE